MLNQLTAKGRLTQTPELRTTEKGTIVRFTLAVDYNRDETTFINCVAFNDRANLVFGKLDKGDQIVVVGKLHQNNYTAKDGTKKSTLEVIVNEIDFVNVKAKDQPKAVLQDAPIPETNQDDDFLPF